MRLTLGMRHVNRDLFSGVCATAFGMVAFGIASLGVSARLSAADCDTYVPSCGAGLCDCGQCDSVPLAANPCDCGKCGKKPFRLNLKNTVVFKALDGVAGGIEHVLGLDSCGTAGCRCKNGGCDSACDSGCGCVPNMPLEVAAPIATPLQMVPKTMEHAVPMSPTPAPIVVSPDATPRTKARSLPTAPPLPIDRAPKMAEPRIVDPEPTTAPPSLGESAPPLTPVPRETPQPETQPEPEATLPALPDAMDSIGEAPSMLETEPQPEAAQGEVTPPAPEQTNPEPPIPELDVQELGAPELDVPQLTIPDEPIEMRPLQAPPTETQPRATQPRGTQPRASKPAETQPRTRPRISDPGPKSIFDELPNTPTPRPREPRPNTQPREGSIFDMLDAPKDGDSAQWRRSPVRPASHGVSTSERRNYQPVYPRVRTSNLPSAQPIGTGLRPATTVEQLRPVNHLEPIHQPANQSQPRPVTRPATKRVLAPYRQSRK